MPFFPPLFSTMLSISRVLPMYTPATAISTTRSSNLSNFSSVSASVTLSVIRAAPGGSASILVRQHSASLPPLRSPPLIRCLSHIGGAPG